MQKTIDTTTQRRTEWQQRIENEINQQKTALQSLHANEVALLSPQPLPPEQAAERDRRALDDFSKAARAIERTAGQEKTTDTGRTREGPDIKPS